VRNPAASDWCDLASLLACPACGAPLDHEAFTSTPEGRCVDGVLRCSPCGHWYPITGAIPRLVLPGPLRPDDGAFRRRWAARVPDAGAETPGRENAARIQVQAAFAEKWRRAPSLVNGSAELHRWFLDRHGWTGTADEAAFLRKRGAILDVGCGVGKDTLRMAQLSPHARVAGLDLTGAVDEGARKAAERRLDNVHFVQGDLMQPPFAPGAFDFVLAEGVLHHTPDTRKALEALLPLLAVGGEIAFYVYRRKAPLREFSDDYLRDRLGELDWDACWNAMEEVTELGRALAQLGERLELPRAVSLLGLPAGNHDLQRFFYYGFLKCFWNDELSYQENVAINFDWFTPRFAWRHREEEVRTWLRDAGLELVHEHVDPSGITMRARRTQVAA
jgi:SAM-dependent methyltransferase/uncharacterized protein YbaR (Trm112 family)